jgi:hypothetical protein
VNGSPITLEKLSYQSNIQVDLAVNGDMAADDDSWQVLPGANASTTTNARATDPVAPQNFVRHVSAANGQGIEGRAWNLMEGKTYTITARVYVVSGGVKMQVTETTAFDRTNTLLNQWQTLTATHTPGSGGIYNRRLQFVGTSGTQTNEFYVDGVTIVENNPDFSASSNNKGLWGQTLRC